MRGRLLVVALLVAVGGFMAAVAYVGNNLRQDYRVLSTGDTERAQLDLDGQHALWLERNGSRPAQVWAYDLAARQRLLLGDGADASQPAAVQGAHAAWVAGNRTVFHDFANGTTWPGPPGLLLPGRTLSGGLAVLRGAGGGAWVYDLATGQLRTADPGGAGTAITGGARLLGDVLVWADGRSVLARSLDGTMLLRIGTNATVANLDADGRTVVWNSDPRPAAPRRVYAASLGESAAREVPAPAGQAWSPAVNGTRVAFVQADGLIRLVDLASGASRVLPARDQENVQPRLAGADAAWLSGTLQGHNVLLVPLR